MKVIDDLLLIEVPSECQSFDINEYGEVVSSEPIYQRLSLSIISCTLPKNDKYVVLGTITKGEITFDVEPFVEPIILLGLEFYPDYMKPEEDRYADAAESVVDSFRSKLASHGIYFTNPIGETEPTPLVYYENHGVSGGSEKMEDWQGVHEWQKMQSQVVTKLLALKKVND